MRNTRRLFATLSAVAAMNAAFGTPTAFSADSKAFPAFACVPLGDTKGLTDPHGDGGIFNISTTQDAWVVCPIVRDNTTAPWTALKVTVIDQNLNDGSRGAVRCRGISASRDTKTVFYTYAVESSGNGNAGQTLTMGSPTSQLPGGPFTLRCKIPPVGADQSGVMSYEIIEPTPTASSN